MKTLVPKACLTAILLSTYLGVRAADKYRQSPAANLSTLPPPSQKQGVTYATDIKPIFDHSCIKCHGNHKPKGHLRLDSLGGVLRGSEDGKVIEPGRSARSVLVQNIAHAGDPDDFMPPPKNRAGIKDLSQKEVALIRAWIDQGAK